VGNLILFNLFIAILLINMEEEKAEEAAEAETEETETSSQRTSTMSYVFGRYRIDGGSPLLGHEASSNLRLKQKAASGERVSSLRLSSDGGSVGDEINTSRMPPRDDPCPDRSLCLFTWRNPIRRFAAAVVRICAPTR